MRLAYFDCFSGVSGVMALGALVHAGANLDDIAERLDRLPTIGFQLERETVEVSGISATRVKIKALPQDVIRTYSSIRAMLEKADLPERARWTAQRIFHRLAGGGGQGAEQGDGPGDLLRLGRGRRAGRGDRVRARARHAGHRPRVRVGAPDRARHGAHRARPDAGAGTRRAGAAARRPHVLARHPGRAGERHGRGDPGERGRGLRRHADDALGRRRVRSRAAAAGPCRTSCAW